MMQDNLNNQNYLQEEDSVDIKKEAGYYLFFWPYFLAGIIIAMVFAFLYLIIFLQSPYVLNYNLP